jgi:hypothetical protein
VNAIDDHRHGSATATPRSKGELIHHMEAMHPAAVKVKFEPHRWTRVALAETHRIMHIGRSEGLEQS